jgi:hypothetical protein
VDEFTATPSLQKSVTAFAVPGNKTAAMNGLCRFVGHGFLVVLFVIGFRTVPAVPPRLMVVVWRMMPPVGGAGVTPFIFLLI